MNSVVTSQRRILARDHEVDTTLSRKYLVSKQKGFKVRLGSLGKFISTAITVGPGSEPDLFKYFISEELANKYVDSLNNKTEVKKVVAIVIDQPNYDKEKVMDYKSNCSYGIQTYISYVTSHTYEGREKYLDTLTKIRFTDGVIVEYLSDIFYYLILRKYVTYNLSNNITHCSSGRSRTADDFYLLAKYKYKLDITFKECLHILLMIYDNKKTLHQNFGLSLSWCSTVDRIVTGISNPFTVEQFREVFNNLKINQKINNNG